MKDKIKILHMYPDILDLYGDGGNMEVIKYRCGQRKIVCETDIHTIGSNTDFSEYDLIYLGGGADFEQQLLANDLAGCAAQIRSAYESGVFFLAICGGYQLMGRYYKDSNGKKIPGLGLFDYYTTASENKSERCIGNIIIEADLNGEKTKVIGFENHGGNTYGVKSPFGSVLLGNGNSFGNSFEGYFEKNVIATYLHGPLLSKKPKVADYIISSCIGRKSGNSVTLAPLDDALENKCREMLFKRFLRG